MTLTLEISLLIPLLIFVPEEEVIEQWIEPKSMPPSSDA